MRWVARAPNVMGVSKNSIFDSFRSPAPKLALVPGSPLVLRHRCIVYTSMWQVSSGLKEDEMGSQGPQCHGGVKNSIFDSFPSPAPKLALVPGSR